MQADSNHPFADADNDMVPDCLELMGHTSPENADTDGDGIDDFEEILTFTNHDASIKTKPVQQDMRVLITSTMDGSGNTRVYMHVLMRFVNLTLSQVRFHDLYCSLNGDDKVSLIDVIGYGDVKVSRRQRKRDGVSYLVSMEIGDLNVLNGFLPCTIGARAMLGTRMIHTGTLLMSTGSGEVASLQPYKANLILQPVSSAVYLQDANPYYRGGGRVCEMGLTQVGSSNSGTLCEVDWAKCKIAAGLRCSSTCSKKAGTTVVIPGGLGTITGR